MHTDSKVGSKLRMPFFKLCMHSRFILAWKENVACILCCLLEYVVNEGTVIPLKAICQILWWNVYLMKFKQKQKIRKIELQHPGFPRGPPPQYWLGDTLLNFADRTGCGAFKVLWPQILFALIRGNIYIIFVMKARLQTQARRPQRDETRWHTRAG